MGIISVKNTCHETRSIIKYLFNTSVVTFRDYIPLCVVAPEAVMPFLHHLLVILGTFVRYLVQLGIINAMFRKLYSGILYI